MKIDLVDFAYQILDIQAEIEFLQRELKHYKELAEEYTDSLNHSKKSHGELMGLMLGAVLDPESVINKGYEAKLKEQLESIK